MTYESEMQKSQHITKQYCSGNGCEVGSGGVSIVSHAIRLDRQRYGHINDGIIHWVGDAQNLPFKDGVLDWLSASHVLEDFIDWVPILKEWARCIKPGGYLIVQLPDHERFRAAVAAGQGDNLDHKHESFPGELTQYMDRLGGFRFITETFVPEGDYNILAVFQKI